MFQQWLQFWLSASLQPAPVHPNAHGHELRIPCPGVAGGVGQPNLSKVFWGKLRALWVQRTAVSRATQLCGPSPARQGLSQSCSSSLTGNRLFSNLQITFDCNTNTDTMDEQIGLILATPKGGETAL